MHRTIFSVCFGYKGKIKPFFSYVNQIFSYGYFPSYNENVTKSQGSPKTKSGISQSTFSDINTVLQLYKTVKILDKKRWFVHRQSQIKAWQKLNYVLY